MNDRIESGSFSPKEYSLLNKRLSRRQLLGGVIAITGAAVTAGSVGVAFAEARQTHPPEDFEGKSPNQRTQMHKADSVHWKKAGIDLLLPAVPEVAMIATGVYYAVTDNNGESASDETAESTNESIPPSDEIPNPYSPSVKQARASTLTINEWSAKMLE